MRLARSLALLLALLFGAPVARTAGAPLPPPPRLTEPMLLGTWDVTWGGIGDNQITFYPDGTAYETYSGRAYVALWWLDARGRLVLREQVLGADGTPCPWATEYTLDASTARLPALECRTESGTRVVLTRR